MQRHEYADLVLAPPARRSQDPEALLGYVSQIGGVADRAGVGRRFTRGTLQKAMQDGHLRPLGRSKLALPEVAEDVAAAHRLGGVLAYRSAAAWWGWELLDPPPRPEIALPRGRHVRTARTGCDVSWPLLAEGDVCDGATSPVRTVLDCATALPFHQALAVADSALRSGVVEAGELREAADRARGRGAAARRRVANAADGRAASVLESAVRATVADIPGLDLDLQVEISGPALVGERTFHARVDLADRRAKLVLEADSFSYRGGRDALVRDARRYDELVARGWTVLRITYDKVRARARMGPRGGRRDGKAGRHHHDGPSA